MDDFVRYLEAKRSVDDRALDRLVWERLREELRTRGGQDLAVADVGAGIGTGALRMRDWRLVEPGVLVHYTAVEPNGELLDEARRRLPEASFASSAFVEQDLARFAAEGEARFDLVVAHAVLDILDLPSSVERLVRLARPGGLVYLPITFDGETVFEPAREEDEPFLSAYHETMEENGSSRTGRRLFHELGRHGTEVLAMGSSDWIVHPVGGAYPDDEAFFLRFLVRTVEGAVRGRVDAEPLDRWVAARRQQIEEAELVYIAHQIDVLARRRP
jgi:SAM-dependent methyltransferase